jgi:zinc protease
MTIMGPGRHLLLLCSIAPLLGLGCARNVKPTTTALPEPVRELQVPGSGFLKTYDNGLTLFVVPDAYTRLIQFDVRQHVGTREDPEGKGGMAHFVEHLMFQMPSNGPGSPKLMSDLPQHTLTFNAYTSSDETHYMHTGMSDDLETYMKYTALRLDYDCSSVDENSFLREREVVRNEHRWRGQGVDLFVFDAISELAFPAGHPYRRKILGADTDLASITPEDSCKFIRRYYTPSQATVVVTGDIEPDEVRKLADKYLAPLPEVAAPPRAPVPPPSFASRNAKVVAPVKKPTAVVLFKMPKRFTPDYVASQAAIETMFLSVAFFVGNRQGSVVKRFYPTFLGGKEASLFGIGVETEKARDLDRAVDEVLDAISRGFAANVEGEEYKGSYDSARQRARLQLLDGIATVFGRSGTYADYLEEGETAGFIGADLAELDALTAVDAQAAGRRIFARDVAMVVKVVPDGSKDKPKADRASFDYKPNSEENLAVPEDIDPAEAHRPLELQDIAPAEGQSLELTLENGMRVVLVQSSDVPVMEMQLIVGAGTRDGGAHPDVAELTAQFFGPRDDLESRNLMSFFDAAGGLFDWNVGRTSSTFITRSLAIYLDFLVAGMSEHVIQAEYGAGALEGWKARRKKELEKKFVRQAAARTNAFAVALYGKGHPHVREVIDDPKDLRDISLRDIETFRAKHYRAANSTLIITGGFDLDLTSKYVESFFGKPVLRDVRLTWNEPKQTAERTPAPEPMPGKIRHFTEVDAERAQTDVTIAYPMATAYGDDHAALLVLADMLNFGVSSVRQTLGASYGVYARLDTDRPRIEIGGSLDSARAGEGFAAIVGAVQALRDRKDFDRQFAFARRNVLREMLNAQADSRLLAGQLAQAVRAGRSAEYFTELARRVATLEPAMVQAQVAKVLREERSVTLIQGPADGVRVVVEHNGISGAQGLPDVVHDEDDD